MNLPVAHPMRVEFSEERVTRATQLLSTRIEIRRERQNPQRLAQIDVRVQMPLRRQGTVAGLSGAAVACCVVGLVTCLVKVLPFNRFGIDPDLVTALAGPVVAGLVYLGVRRIKHRVTRVAK